MFVTDTALFEEIEKTSIGAESPTNLLSSGTSRKNMLNFRKYIKLFMI